MEKHNRLKALKSAFPYTIPVMTGYIFLGAAYGIYMNVAGLSMWYAILLSLVVYAGAMQFAATAMLLAPFAPFEVFAVTLMVQARHLFYGISLMNRYKGMGWKKFYLIFGMTDETFSINCSVDIPEDTDKGWFMLWVTLLDHIYWVTGTVLGSVIGGMMTFNTEGLDFVMTAMFAVIFLEQWLKDKKHHSAIIGGVASIACLAIFGPDNFLIPTMLCILALLGIFQKPIEKAVAEK